MKKRCYWMILFISCLFLFAGCRGKEEDAEVKMGMYMHKLESGLFSNVYLDEKEAMFSYSVFADHFVCGSYEIEGNYLTITDTDENESQYVFEINGDTLKLLLEKSAEIPDYGEGFDWDNMIYEWTEE